MTNLCCVGGIVRAFKTLRLLRLAKLLRVARIKKMLEKYEDQFDANQYLGLLFTLFSTRSVQCICDTCVCRICLSKIYVHVPYALSEQVSSSWPT